METHWHRIFKGAVSTTRPNVGKEHNTVGPLGLRPFRKKTSDPGVYTLTVCACVNVAIGRRRACHELTRDGTGIHPDLIVYALSSRVVE